MRTRSIVSKLPYFMAQMLIPEPWESSYLIQCPINTVINYLKNPTSTRKLTRHAHVAQAEVAYACRVDHRHNVCEVVWFFGTQGCSKLPASRRMCILNLDGKSVDLYLWCACIDYHVCTTTRPGGLLVVIETGGWWPVEDEVCGRDGAQGHYIDESWKKHGDGFARNFQKSRNRCRVACSDIDYSSQGNNLDNGTC